MQKYKLLGLGIVSLALAAATTAQAQPYSNAVMALNPVAYLPLTETTPTPFGYYVATNLGTFGAAANAYYQTWYQPNGTAFYPTNSILHTTGATGDGDTALSCNGSKGAGQYLVMPRVTNGVPNAATAILAPFTVEFWAMAGNTNIGSVQAIVTQGRNPAEADASVGLTNTFKGFSVGEFKNFYYFQVYNASRNSNSGVPECDTPPLVPNTWYHIVATCDGTNISLYQNGALVSGPKTVGANFAGQRYVPDPVSPLVIGTGTEYSAANGSVQYTGAVDEVAIYTNVLDPTVIQNHFAAGAGSSYASTVLGDNPSIYLRLDEPAFTSYPDPSTYPVAHNYGLVGSAANGVYQLGTSPGVAGPAYSGFGPSSSAVAFNGFFGGVDIGGGALPPELNPTNTNPVTVAAWFKTGPTDARGRFQVIAGHSDNSWRFGYGGANGDNHFNTGPSTNELQFASVADVVTNGFFANDGQWHMVAGVFDGTTESMYIDGVLAKTRSTFLSPVTGSTLDAFIGGDPTYNNPSYNSPHVRGFLGSVSHFALFTNALTAAQITQLYGAAGVPVTIALQPQSISGNAGGQLTLSVGVRGSPPFTYQWYKNGSIDPGATSSSLVFNPSGPGDAGSYFVVVTNATGSVTSSVAQVTLISAPIITQQTPTSVQVFRGSSPTLRVSAIGPSLAYQWTLNSSPISGATTSAYTLANIQTGGTYGCTVNNSFGSAAISPISVTVLTPPAVTYPATVVADHPLAYYRLDEASGTIAYDNVGGLNGIYTNVTQGQTPGYSANDPADLFAYFGNTPTNSLVGWVPSFLSFGSPNGTNSAFSVEAWVNGGFNPQTSDAGIVALGAGNGGEQFNLDCGGRDPAHDYRFFVRNAAGQVAGPVNATNAPTDNNWHHVVGVCDQPNGLIKLYVDGVIQGSAAIGTNAGILSSSAFMSIGSRQSGPGSQFDNQFLGGIDEVSVYGYALSQAQVLNHYYSSGIIPFMTVQPTNTIGNEGGSATFYSAAGGTPPLAYQWYDVSSGNPTLMPGQTSSNLTLNNIQLSDNGRAFQVTVTNLYGEVTSLSAGLTVQAGPPILLTDISPLFSEGYAGSPFTYSVEVTGSAPITYSWTRNGSPIAGASSSSYSFNSLVGTNLYAVSIHNNQGTISSSTATNVGFAVPTLSATNYAYKMKITFSGYNRNETLNFFPALVQIGTNTPGFAYSQAAPNGGDLRFTDATGSRELPSEIDEWNPNGVSSIWVQLPALSGNTNFIWAYWGNPAATTPEAWSTNGEVWVPAFGAAPGYKIVYHMKEAALPFADSTTQHPATNGVAPAPVPGIVGTGGSFTGGNFLDAGSNDLGAQFTISAWVNIPASVSDIQTLWANQVGGFGQPGFAFFVDSYQQPDRIIDFATGIGNNTGSEARTANGTVTSAQWHLISAAVDQAGGAGQIYMDGNAVPLSGGFFYPGFTNAAELFLGQFSGGAFGFHGTMDEARLSGTTNSANWIWAEYQTVAQNSTFETYSPIVSSVVTLTYSVSGNNLILSWPQGTLQAAPAVTGTYTDLTTATSPYSVPLTGPQQYFRVKVR